MNPCPYRGWLVRILLSAGLEGEIFKGIVHTLEYIPPDITLPQTYDQLPGVFCHMACDIDQIVDDCPVSAAFYSSFLAGIPLPKRFLPYHA